MKIVDYGRSALPADSNLFYCDRWISVLAECYGFQFKMVVDEKPLLIFAEVQDVYGSRIISMPFSDYTEPYVTEDEQITAIADFLMREYSTSIIILKLHGQYEQLTPIGFENIRQAFCHRIDLKTGEDEVWQKTGRHFKKGVRKARENRVTVKAVNSEDGVTIFYDMLTRLRRVKFNILPQSKEFYSLLYKHFIQDGQGNIWVAFHKDNPVASAFVLHSGNVMFDKMGVSEPSHLDLRPNNLLLWEVMKYGIEQRKCCLDMGLSQVDYEGLIRFKDSLGGQRSSINFYRYLPPGYDGGRDSEIKKLFSSITHFLVESSMSDAELQHVSDFLYKYFC